MDPTGDELLQPSLSRRRISAAPYSLQTVLLTSFFGGPLAGVILIGVNARLLGRLAKDALVLVVLAILVVAVEALLIHDRAAIESWLKDTIGFGTLRLTIQALGIATFGVAYWLHRDDQRSAELQGIERPNGLIGGLACTLVGFVLQTPLIYVIAAMEMR